MEAGRASDILTEPEMAAELRISLRKLQALRYEGKVPFVQIGRAVRYVKAAVLTWFATLQKGGNNGQ
jgi:excisionase family DNA binding protein